VAEREIEVTGPGESWAPSPRLEAELVRVGATTGTAGFAHGVLAVDFGERVRFLGPPTDSPRRRWAGTEREALIRLARLADGAGIAAFWAAFAVALSERL
jgi:hypothetical protein